MWEPSADQDIVNVRPCERSRVSCVQTPVPGFITDTCDRPSLTDMNASRWPSGDRRGRYEMLGPPSRELFHSTGGGASLDARYTMPSPAPAARARTAAVIRMPVGQRPFVAGPAAPATA